MVATVDRALSQLARRALFSVRLGLDRVQRALEALGRPERCFAAIQIAGTNGKGSTAAMVAACLTRAGYRTGLFTSPHLHRFSERIVVSGVEIDGVDLGRLLAQVLALDEELTFFEVATVAAFAHFAERRVDVAVVETGLGGRLDATTVLQPRVCAISPIGLDHMQVLGSDLASIAAEKAGIVKPMTPVVCARQAADALAPLTSACTAARAPLYVGGREYVWSSDDDGLLSFQGWRSRLDGLRLGLRGRYQRDNAALALATLDALADRGLDSAAAARRAGLAGVRWPGRLEWIGRFLLDGAHNPSAMRVLLGELPVRGDWTVVYGASADKQVGQMLALLRPRAKRLIVTRAASLRAMSPGRLLACCPAAEASESLFDALTRARQTNGPVLVTGSLILVGEARQILLGERVDAIAVTDPAAQAQEATIPARG